MPIPKNFFAEHIGSRFFRTKSVASPDDGMPCRKRRLEAFSRELNAASLDKSSQSVDTPKPTGGCMAPGFKPADVDAKAELPVAHQQQAQYLPGDFNHDGSVDLNDLNILRNSFGQEGKDLAADADGDGVIGDGDRKILSDNFGRSASLPT